MLSLILVFSAGLLSSGCMRIFGPVIQPMKNDDVPGLYRPTVRTGYVIWLAAQGKYYTFASGYSSTEGGRPSWGRLGIFSLLLPLEMAGDTLVLPYDTYRLIRFHWNPPYWYCIRTGDWEAFDRRLGSGALPDSKDFRTFFSLPKEELLPQSERFRQLSELGPDALRETTFPLFVLASLPRSFLDVLLEHRHSEVSSADLLFCYAGSATFTPEAEDSLKTLLEGGVDPNLVESFQPGVTMIDTLLKLERESSSTQEKAQIRRRIDLFRRFGGRSFVELVQCEEVKTPVPLSVAPERLDPRLRPVFEKFPETLLRKWNFFLAYPGLLPLKTPALIVLSHGELRQVRLYELTSAGEWSESPTRSWWVPGGWYGIITPKRVLLPEEPSPLPTFVPERRHIPLNHSELYFCGEVIQQEDMEALTRIFSTDENRFASTWPGGGTFRYAGNAGRPGWIVAGKKDAPFLAKFREIVEPYHLPGDWKTFTVIYGDGIPREYAVLEYRTRRFVIPDSGGTELDGVETDGFRMHVYPPELFEHAASDLPCGKRRRGYWNEIGPENRHNLRVSIFYGDRVSPETLEKLIELARELRLE